MLLPAATFRYDLTAAEIASLTAALVEQLQLASADVLSIDEAYARGPAALTRALVRESAHMHRAGPGACEAADSARS